MKRFVFIITLLLCLVIAAVVANADEGYDLTTVSGITASELAEYMHPDTAHLAEDVVRICRENGVSAEFIATIMRWEKRPDIHNYFGWTSFDGSLRVFGSDLDCLETVIPAIKRNYLSQDGKYFSGYTVAAVSRYYNNSDFWRNTILEGTLYIVEDYSSRPRPAARIETIEELLAERIILLEL